ncbi:MAG: DUF721 domain-containing protein [Candidatus Gastranaerophilales bacterium]|nr:DUF721 domain-containing protein [Candidatus Gastranaerophilales bacterium]
MKKILYSDFESIKDIIGALGISYNAPKETNKDIFFNSWADLVGEKISKLSRPIELNDKNVLTVLCANSFIANELFLSKKNLMEIISQKAEELDLKVEDIRFDYKNWKK